MACRIVILGASYGSLLSTKLLMAGHDVTLVCLPDEAELINSAGTIVRITLKGEDEPRLIRSGEQPGRLNARTPDEVDPGEFDLVGLAMQEPQFRAPQVWELIERIAEAGKPCLSIMNMPPLAYLRRIPGLQTDALRHCYTEPKVWDAFSPDCVTLCSPDPQAFRPPEESLNFLHVGLPTNFKAAKFASEAHNAILNRLAEDIASVRLDGQDVPVKLRVHDSLFVPFAKWSMLLTGNYRAITPEAPRSIKEAVHSDIEQSREIYAWVDSVAARLGAGPEDHVPFEKYAKAAQSLLKPSSAARAAFAGAAHIERVDKLVQAIGRTLGLENAIVDDSVEVVDARLELNRSG
ncbi:MAG: hypothetical protein OXJ64_11865 [Boseongicola sp.]|nr:hypothetical protein [Boseongicola sp.]